MPDPTGRWLNAKQWQCPKCGYVNASADVDCQKCGESVRPPESEPVRPLDPLDLISQDATRLGDSRPVELATKAVHTVTRVTREKAMALIGESLRNSLKKRGEPGDRAWQAINDLPEDEQRAAVAALLDDLEKVGFALYEIDEDGHDYYHS